MTTYNAKSTDTLHFSLTQNDYFIGKLTYDSWFSFKSNILMANNESYQIEPKGFWESTIEVKDNNKTLLKFKMNWKGDIVIHTNFDSTEQDFLFEHKGILKDSFVLINREKQELVVIKHDLKWNKINYEYQLETTDIFDSFKNKDIFLLILIHCANYYMSNMDAAILATM